MLFAILLRVIFGKISTNYGNNPVIIPKQEFTLTKQKGELILKGGHN